MNSVEGSAPPQQPTADSASPLRPIWLLLLVLVGQAISYSFWINDEYQFNQFNRDDTAFYVSLAHSLAQGRGYTRSLDPNHYIPHAHYAPGLSWPVAICFLIADSMLLPHLLMAATALANTVLLWVIVRRYLSVPLTFLTVVLAVTSPVFDQLATVVMTEQLSIFFLLLSIWGFLRWGEGGYRLDRWFLLTAVALGYGLLVRGLLFPLLPSFGLYAWFDRQSSTPMRARFAKATLLLLLALIPFFGWGIRNRDVPATGFEGRSHLDEMRTGGIVGGPEYGPSDYAALAWQNFRYHFSTRMLDAVSGIGWVLDTHFDTQLNRTGSLVVVGIVAASFLVLLVSGYRYWLLLSIVGFSLALLLIWPWGGAQRYWVQFNPILLLILVLAASLACARLLPERLQTRTVQWATVTLLALAGTGVLVYDHLQREPQYGHAWQALAEMAKEAGEKVPPEAYLISQSWMPVGFIAGVYHGQPDDRVYATLRGEPIDEPVEVYVIVQSPEAIEETQRKGPKLAALHGPGRGHLPGVPQKLAENEYYTLYRLLPENAPQSSPPSVH